MSGTGKDIDFEQHEDDKKTFYGLMKKKASVKESTPSEQAEKLAAETPAGETGVTGYYGIDSDMAPPKETDAVDAADERLSRIFQSEPAKSAVITEPSAPVKPVAEPEPAAGIASAEAIPAGPASRAATPSGQETGNVIFPAGSLETEEDIMKELTSIVKPGEGVVKSDEEEKVEKGKGKKDKSKLRQKIVFEPYDPEKHGPMTSFPGVTGYEEVERYWVDEPYAFIVILYNESTNNYLYYVCEPSLTMFEKELLVEVYDRLQDVLMMENLDATTDKKELLREKVNQTISDYIGKIDTKSYYKIMYYINRDYLEFGKINPLMHDNFIEDISNNGFDTPVFLYHKNYENIMTNIVYGERQLDSYVIRLAQRCGKHISIAEPMVDATMPDGSRIQLTLGKEVTTRGSTFTIRKFKEVPITPIDLIAWNTFSSEIMSYLWLCIENNKSLIFSGGTASGKTSSLNAVSLFIPPKAKVVSLEDTRELKLPHMNWIPGLTRDSFTADGKGAIEMYTLLKAALRQRPEYLLVGEVRGKEALTLFQAMSTGHTTFSTMHADSVESAIHRLENPPISVPRTMITALDIISIQAQTYLKNKRVRRNMKIVEINDIDPNTRNIRTNDIFVWNSSTDRFERVGESRVLGEIAQRRAWSKRELSAELMRRQKVLEYMLNNNIREFKQIAAIIHAYAVKPDRVLETLGIKE
ncbi:putative bacterial type II secretion system protein [Methanocella paludicola SANAE]|uniref:Bacterial type II secretion system protein n=2 Tax=Methanocella TaxID=570266 RepID=D1YY77_METPS|nr:putative bacterial type II secretion system protein [Methanocella paludicola SANAE]